MTGQQNIFRIMTMDKKIKKKKWTLKRISIYGFGLLFIAFILWSFLFADKRSKVKIDAEKITIGTVQNGIFQDFHTGYGKGRTDRNQIFRCNRRWDHTINRERIRRDYLKKEMLFSV